MYCSTTATTAILHRKAKHSMRRQSLFGMLIHTVGVKKKGSATVTQACNNLR